MDDAPNGLVIFALCFVAAGALVLLLWMIHALSRATQQPKSRPAASRTAQTPRARPALPSAPETTPQPSLSLRQWLDRANHQPDKNPHVAVTGPSGAGKTTLVLAMLQDRPGQVAVCTPKHADDDGWGGLPAVRLRPHDMGFQPIGQAIGAVYQEMLRRNAQGARDASWLTLVIDDFSTVIGKLPELREQVLDLVTLGRSVRIRLILIATERNVKAWGWEGRGEARHNVLFVECAEDRSATIARWGKGPEPIDTRGVLQLAGRALPEARWWELPVLEIDEAPAAIQPASPSGPSSEQVVKVTTWLIYEPTISTRELARRLYPGTDGGGDYSTRAKAVRVLAEKVLAEALLAVRTRNNTSESASPNGLTPAS